MVKDNADATTWTLPGTKIQLITAAQRTRPRSLLRQKLWVKKCAERTWHRAGMVTPSHGVHALAQKGVSYVITDRTAIMARYSIV